MQETYYSVEQIAEMLKIHPKTVQRYIREGKLRATKIGKGWRISGHDLSLFIENERVEIPSLGRQPERLTIASSVIDIPVSRRSDAIRIMNTLCASMNSKPPEYDRSSMQSQYIEREEMVRVTLWGDIRFMAVLLDTIIMLIERNDEE